MPWASCWLVAARLGRCSTLRLHRAISSSRLSERNACTTDFRELFAEFAWT